MALGFRVVARQQECDGGVGMQARVSRAQPECSGPILHRLVRLPKGARREGGFPSRFYLPEQR